jgi:hypothetical protein
MYKCISCHLTNHDLQRKLLNHSTHDLHMQCVSPKSWSCTCLPYLFRQTCTLLPRMPATAIWGQSCTSYKMQTHTLFCGTCREIFINLESYMDHCTKFHFPIMLENLSMHTINKIRTSSFHINNSLPWKNQWQNIVDPYTHFNELMPELYSTLPPTNQVSNLN